MCLFVCVCVCLCPGYGMEDSKILSYNNKHTANCLLLLEVILFSSGKHAGQEINLSPRKFKSFAECNKSYTHYLLGAHLGSNWHAENCSAGIEVQPLWESPRNRRENSKGTSAKAGPRQTNGSLRTLIHVTWWRSLTVSHLL